MNLLPQQEQRALANEYRLRLAAVTLYFLGALGVIALTALIPSIFLSYEKEAAATSHDEILKKDLAFRSKDDLSGVLKMTDEKVAALGADRAIPYAYELVGDVIKNKTSGIEITGISSKQSEGGSRDSAVMGRSRDRDALRAFAEALQNEKAFSDAVVPVSNFAEAADITFSILVKVK